MDDGVSEAGSSLETMENGESSGKALLAHISSQAERVGALEAGRGEALDIASNNIRDRNDGPDVRAHARLRALLTKEGGR